VARGLALVAILIGTATVVEYVSGQSLGLDQFLFRDLHRYAATNPGRPSPQTAVLFVLLGVALWALNSKRSAGSPLPRVLNGAAFLVAVFAVIGYGYGISGLNRVATLTPIALTSAITFIVLCLGIAAADPKGVIAQLSRTETSGMVAAKRLLPITVIVLPILGWLQLRGQASGLYSAATGVALMVLLSTLLFSVAVLSLTKRLSELDVQRRIGIEREARLAALVDATNDAVLSIDVNGAVTSWNRAAEELYGHTEAEMLGRSVDMLAPSISNAQHREMLAAVAKGHPRVDIEVQRMHKDGSLRPTSVTISRIMQNDELIGFCGVSHDISERIRARDELERRVRQRTQDLSNSRAETLQRLALAAEYRDDDTAQHTSRVGKGSEQLAARLGLPSGLVQLIGQAAPLHDVGKIGIPDKLLHKPGPLTDDEAETMKQHTVLGSRLLAGSGYAVLQLAEQIARSHHERWDGSGYPHGLAGEAIPIAGRIVAVVDTFDAMTNDRPYHPARSIDEALAEIDRCSGSLFDPKVAATFCDQYRHLTSRPLPCADGEQGAVPRSPSSPRPEIALVARPGSQVPGLDRR
jgi:PAS domain S-box-containing protein